MGSPAAGTGEIRLLEITLSGAWPPHTSAAGGQVEPVLGRFNVVKLVNTKRDKKSQVQLPQVQPEQRLVLLAETTTGKNLAKKTII